MSKKSKEQQDLKKQNESNQIISYSNESLNMNRYNPFASSSDENNSSPKNKDYINLDTPNNSKEVSIADENLNNSNEQKKLKEDLAINTNQENNNDLIENENEIPKPKNTEDLFDIIKEEKKDEKDEKEKTWFNRDGRKEKDEFAENALKKIMADHEKMSKLKQDISTSISELESIQFNMYYVKVYSKENPILLKDKLRPRIKFENLKKVPDILRQNLKLLQYEYLTPVQRVIMPYIQYGKDIVCITETGSGKTLSYLFSIIGQMLIQGVPENPYLIKDEFYNMYNNNNNNNDDNEKSNNNDLYKNVIAYPICLIIVPSRELAIQISKESKKLAQNTGIKTVDIIGGDKKIHQLIELSKGCDILVCTPMRLQQYINSGKVNLKMVKYLVLDEADKMLNYEFYEQLKNIFDNLPEKRFRQNLLFSATLDDDVKGIANYCLNNYYYFNSVKECPKTIKHLFYKCNSTEDKFEHLINFLKNEENRGKNILIFVNNKKGVDDIMKAFQQENIQACSIHGSKTQNDRNKSIRDFSLGYKKILISTDLISRGIDFPYLYCVINFDVPNTIEEYIHRIGRAGRLGQKGLAITYLDRIDDTNKDNLINLLNNLGEEIPSWINDVEYRKKTDYSEQKTESYFNKNFSRRNNNSNNTNNKNDWNDNTNNNNGWGDSNNNNTNNEWNDNTNNNNGWGNSNNNNEWNDNTNNNFNNNRQRRDNQIRRNNNNRRNYQNNEKNNDNWNNNNSNNSFNNNNNSRNNDRQRNNNFNNNRNNNNNNNNFESRRNNNFNNNMNNKNNNRNNRNQNNNWNRKNNTNNIDNNNNRNDWNSNNNNNDPWDSTNSNSYNINSSNNNTSNLPEDVNEELFIRGINYQSEEDDIRNTFSKYGQIIFCKILKDKETNKSKGIGFVKFQEKFQAYNAMKDADNIECQGRKLKINYSMNKNNNRDNKPFNKNNNFNDKNNNNRNKRNFQNRNTNNNMDNNNNDNNDDDGWNERNNVRERSREKENNNFQSNNNDDVDSW